MKSNARRPGIEIAAEWIAACCLGAAVGWSVLKLTPLGPIMAGAAGLACAAAALLAMSRVAAEAPSATAAFAPVDFPAAGGDDALLLDTPVEEEALLLDDPVATGEESRVVRLFGAAPQSGGAAIPAPGEMLARIEDFLGVARGSAGAAEPAPPANLASAEASAALHAALADIRRSLRQG